MLVLPQASVAFHVRSIPVSPEQLAVEDASEKVIVALPPQLTVAVASPVLEVLVDWPHCNCLSGGQVITGG